MFSHVSMQALIITCACHFNTTFAITQTRSDFKVHNGRISKNVAGYPTLVIWALVFTLKNSTKPEKTLHFDAVENCYTIRKGSIEQPLWPCLTFHLHIFGFAELLLAGFLLLLLSVVVMVHIGN